MPIRCCGCSIAHAVPPERPACFHAEPIITLTLTRPRPRASVFVAVRAVLSDGDGVDDGLDCAFEFWDAEGEEECAFAVIGEVICGHVFKDVDAVLSE